MVCVINIKLNVELCKIVLKPVKHGSLKNHLVLHSEYTRPRVHSNSGNKTLDSDELMVCRETQET